MGLLRRVARLPRNVYAIGLVSLLNDASSEMIYPFLPVFLTLTLGASPAILGVIEGLAESASSLLKLLTGYMSDRLGRRKPLIVFGYGLAGIARAFLPLVTSWPQALASRVSDRMGKGLRGSPRDALLADSVDAERRGLAFGLHRAMDHAGAVVGPLAAYALIAIIAADAKQPNAVELRRMFFYAAVPGLLSVLIAVLFISEERPKGGSSKRSDAPKRLTLRGFDSRFVRFLGVLALFTLSNSSDAFLLLRATSAGVAPSTLPLLWAAMHVVKVASSIFGGDLSDRIGRRSLIAAGWIVYSGVYAGFAFAASPWHAWALFLVYGIYFGLTEGTEKALVADLVPADRRGEAFGMYNLAVGITVLPASLIMGGLWSLGGPVLAFLVSAVLGICATLLLVAFVSPVEARDRDGTRT